MSQTNIKSYEENLIQLKHPWQPDWVCTKQDAEIFLKLMEHYRYLVDDERDWYPPFIVFLEEINGKVMVGSILSKWHTAYDPHVAGKPDPLHILRANGVKV
jgi:hypothetical protein